MEEKESNQRDENQIKSSPLILSASLQLNDEKQRGK
jgi:hypothetical protein